MSDVQQDAAGLRDAGLSKGRIEALTDGIYAVAMTLLVIELKVPDAHLIHTHDELVRALVDVVPKAGAWLVSFFVLAMFWLGHHRLYHHVRVVDQTLLWRNLLQLALVALLPFSASLIGEFGAMREAHYVYNGNMILLSLTSIWQLVHVRRHPALLTAAGFPSGQYHAALLRTGGLAVAGGIALLIASFATFPVFATYAYLLMGPLGAISRRMATKRDGHLAPAATPPKNKPRPS